MQNSKYTLEQGHISQAPNDQLDKVLMETIGQIWPRYGGDKNADYITREDAKEFIFDTIQNINRDDSQELNQEAMALFDDKFNEVSTNENKNTVTAQQMLELIKKFIEKEEDNG